VLIVQTGPFTQEVSQVLRLHNPTSDPIAFKVKTTAPKQYVPPPTFHLSNALLHSHTDKPATDIACDPIPAASKPAAMSKSKSCYRP